MLRSRPGGRAMHRAARRAPQAAPRGDRGRPRVARLSGARTRQCVDDHGLSQGEWGPLDRGAPAARRQAVEVVGILESGRQYPSRRMDGWIETRGAIASERPLILSETGSLTQAFEDLIESRSSRAIVTPCYEQGRESDRSSDRRAFKLVRLWPGAGVLEDGKVMAMRPRTPQRRHRAAAVEHRTSASSTSCGSGDTPIWASSCATRTTS